VVPPEHGVHIKHTYYLNAHFATSKANIVSIFVLIIELFKVVLRPVCKLRGKNSKLLHANVVDAEFLTLASTTHT